MVAEFAHPHEPTVVLAGRNPESASAVELFAFKMAQAIERGERSAGDWRTVRSALHASDLMRTYAQHVARCGAIERSSNYYLARDLLEKHAPTGDAA